MISVYHDTMNGSCGVGIVSDFEDKGSQTKPSWGGRYLSATDCNKGGAGWICAGFIENDDVSTDVFIQMSAKYKLVFRTPTRINKNTENPFYFAVFDTEGVDIPQGYDECEDF